MPLSNEIRIIGGRWRGRRVRFPARDGVRPTPDRVRETLFNWLGQDLTGASTLDPFTGSGALSLEALSRGATLAVAIDSDASVVRALAATGVALGASGLEAHRAEAHAWLARDTRLFDVIFLDPPFDNAGWDALLPAAVLRLAHGGVLYAESRAVLVAPAGLEITQHDKAGQVHYHLLRRTQPD
ncbi:MAG: 16S rRNA (guanine(966)-N(2))-methyltransferase RsmD [Casimicrobiaceae bacterium]